MSAVTVGSLGAAIGIVSKVQAIFRDFRPLWDRIERKVLPEAQKRQWDTFGNVSPATALARARRIGYYRNRPSADAGTRGPRYRWTGHFQRSTTLFSDRGPTLAKIFPDRNYRGPIGPGAFSRIVGAVIPEDRIWNRAYIEKGIEREMEKWVAEEVAKL